MSKDDELYQDELKKFLYDEIQKISSSIREDEDIGKRVGIYIKSDSLFSYRKGYKDALSDILNKLAR
jgi:hypothetical protein